MFCSCKGITGKNHGIYSHMLLHFWCSDFQIKAMSDDVQPLLAEVRDSGLLGEVESLTKSLTLATEELRLVPLLNNNDLFCLKYGILLIKKKKWHFILNLNILRKKQNLIELQKNRVASELFIHG